MIRLISIAIEILSVIGLLYGYGNKSRNIMFLCGLLLLLGVAHLFNLLLLALFRQRRTASVSTVAGA